MVRHTERVQSHRGMDYSCVFQRLLLRSLGASKRNKYAQRETHALIGMPEKPQAISWFPPP
jgi:hypothetical protein